ncbi:hypothetical protein GCK72_003113 [Caenorhabditis remanei]|uniref:Uncharacterized protein n=1 Tax=Caenorhabditis remanei TaxID=31234 RepID=A0A6A5HXM8_CAERE|nr:hypothetical protein GCK72_003113 [Caenorhabditis remanei]KAF1771287.1 hypothetical protein GCK72_003113 [Caenorhabditis remanei]
MDENRENRVEFRIDRPRKREIPRMAQFDVFVCQVGGHKTGVTHGDHDEKQIEWGLSHRRSEEHDDDRDVGEDSDDAQEDVDVVVKHCERGGEWEKELETFFENFKNFEKKTFFLKKLLKFEVL